MIVVPVAPTRIPKIPWSPRPTAPPCAEPSAASRPKVVTARPVRNGLTSTSALRATIREPTTTKATGATYVAAPIAAMKPSAIQPPTIPPLHPRYRIDARKTPSATSPSPISSGCCWFLVFPLRRFVRTRAGRRGLSVRLFLRRAMRGASPSAPLRFPTRKLRPFASASSYPQPAGGNDVDTRAASGPKLSAKPVSSAPTTWPPPTTTGERPAMPGTEILAWSVVSVVLTAIT